VQRVSDSVSERVDAHVVDTRKKTQSISRAVETRTAALVAEIQEHKAEIDCSLHVRKQYVGRKEMSTERERLQFGAGGGSKKMQ
jgi:hypothetical protein